MSWTIKSRREALGRLKAEILRRRGDLERALHDDLHKSAAEAYLTEIGPLLAEVSAVSKHMKRWLRGRRVGVPLFLLPARAEVWREPYGRVLIIAPWNYPLQLAILPLVGAVAAGNSVVVKCSPDAPATERVVGEIIEAVFAPDHVRMERGGIEKVTQMLAERWDYIFFTGSTATGRVVARAAAENLTPVTLELGGKSPCVIGAEADLKIAARRVAWGKFINAGQTCVAPDYVFVAREVAAEFLEHLERSITELFGADASKSDNYGRIVSHRSFDRLIAVWPSAVNDRAQKYIAPTVCRLENAHHPLMRDEIFGPLLPVLTYETIDEVADYINKGEKPLAAYYFGCRSLARQFLERCPSGGACVNDVVVHLGNDHLPFGGVGASGMGEYHGRYSIETFSRVRAVHLSWVRFDMPMRYRPMKYIGLIKRFLK